jgi:hypothetical protein
VKVEEKRKDSWTQCLRSGYDDVAERATHLQPGTTTTQAPKKRTDPLLRWSEVERRLVHVTGS